MVTAFDVGPWNMNQNGNMNDKKESNELQRLPYSLTPYFKVGKASDLSGMDRIFYRFLEILPGFLSWGTLIGIVLLSMFVPIVAAYFIIGFAFYWLLKTIYLSAHLRYSWRRMQFNLKEDWGKRLRNLKHEHIWHLVLLPYYTEPYEVIERTIEALLAAGADSKRMIIVLASEERGGVQAEESARRIKEKYGSRFGYLMVTTHPADTPGEIAGKGSNLTWAIEKARTDILDVENISYEDVIVSSFDIDTVVYPQYFECLTWHFLTSPEPHKSSFQPVPFFHNNIWDAVTLSRVVAISSSFWEMIQQERPERMATFSSHAMSFKALYEIGYWQTNMVNEDSRIFWNLLVANDGNYTVVPISYPVSMDATTASTFFGTVKNIYLQHHRWTYGVENWVYMVFNFVKNKKIPLGKRIRIAITQGEGYWSLVTNPLILFVMGWLPLFLGGRTFGETVLSYNLTVLVRDLLFLAMFGLLISAFISIQMLPPRPPGGKRIFYVFMALQWILVPMTMIIFSAIPGLHAQTRLMFAWYLGFWNTPKGKTTKDRQVVAGAAV